VVTSVRLSSKPSLSRADGNSGPPAKPERTGADRSHAHSQADEILQMLIRAARQGCTNLELWTVAHAAHSRIADLRAQGHRITCTRECVGVYRYVLIENPPPKPDAPRPTPYLPHLAT
jgi:hypothetical protein